MADLVRSGVSLLVGIVVLVVVTEFIDVNLASFTGTTLLVVGFLGPFFAIGLLRKTASVAGEGGGGFRRFGRR